MTNNNWIEEFDEIQSRLDFQNSCTLDLHPTYPVVFTYEIIDFISNLLTKKDQEHKAELEMIKGEMREVGFSICSAHQKYDENCFICKSSNIRTEDALSILDKHINK